MHYEQSKRNRWIFYAASAATAAGGIVHLTLAPVTAHATNIGVFFLMRGILQLYWELPTIKQWSKTWNYAGIAGTAVLVAVWSITRMTNPIVGKALAVNEMGVIAEASQIAFIVLTAIISSTCSAGPTKLGT